MRKGVSSTLTCTALAASWEVTRFGKLGRTLCRLRHYWRGKRARALIEANEGHGGVFVVGCRMEGWRGKHFSLRKDESEGHDMVDF
jgi:hypothetical protein